MSVEALHAVFEDRDVKGAAKAVLLSLANHAHADGTEAYPSVPTIMGESGLSRSAVFDALARLKDDGQIVPYGHRGQRVVYRLTRPAAGPVQQPDQSAKDTSPAAGPVLDADPTRAGAGPHPSGTRTGTRPGAGPEPSSNHPSTTPEPIEMGGEHTSTSDIDRVWTAYLAARSAFAGKPVAIKLDEKRRRRIRSRLKDCTIEQVELAVAGWQHSAWHCGQNPDGKTYFDLSTVLRDAEQVEKFAELATDHANGRTAASTGLSYAGDLARFDEVLA